MDRVESIASNDRRDPCVKCGIKRRNYTTGGTIARHSAMARIHHASIQAPSIENIVEMRVESVGLCRRPKVAVISEGTVAERLAGYQRVLNYCNSARGINLTQSSSTPPSRVCFSLLRRAHNRATYVAHVRTCISIQVLARIGANRPDNRSVASLSRNFSWEIVERRAYRARIYTKSRLCLLAKIVVTVSCNNAMAKEF